MAALFSAVNCAAATPDQVLIVQNRQSGASRTIAEYYARRRNIPASNICTIDTAPTEVITRDVFVKEIQTPIGAFLREHKLQEQILYIVTTMGVPLTVQGEDKKLQSTTASVDSELTLLYQQLRGIHFPLEGAVPNPFFQQRDAPFQHPNFPIYLVNRLAAYTLEEVKGIIDKALLARNRGKYVIDTRADEKTDGNHWLRTASVLLPGNRLVLDDSAKILKGIKDVIGYASWGSNDKDRKDRYLGFTWLPGAIATEFVLTNARTFSQPPQKWNIGTWADRSTWFFGSPQTMVADYIHEGATGAAGHVTEPFLHMCPRPDYVLPAYHSGRTLAESFYMGIPGLSWVNIVIGDPLCRLATP